MNNGEREPKRISRRELLFRKLPNVAYALGSVALAGSLANAVGSEVLQLRSDSIRERADNIGLDAKFLEGELQKKAQEEQKHLIFEADSAQVDSDISLQRAGEIYFPIAAIAIIPMIGNLLLEKEFGPKE